MKTAKVTYNAPRGDSKVVEMGGVTFFDGQEVELNSDEHGHLMSKLPNNQHFTFAAGEDVAAAPKGKAKAEKAKPPETTPSPAPASEPPAPAVLPTVQPVP